jgi:hypothetical protein
VPRYAAKLLFQFRVHVDRDPAKRRICEERIINFSARSPREALRQVRRRGKQEEFSYESSDGIQVTFEFVGIMDAMRLGLEAEADEVWYEIRQRLLPMERRSRIVPPDDILLHRLAT